MINLGLQRISTLVAKLGNPVTGLKVFHVAGTNGKGSVCTYLESVLSRGLNAKVGKFTSPYLVVPNDAIQIGQKPLTPNEYLQLKNEVESISRERDLNASEFEVQMAVAFQAFKKHAVDYAVIEVGLGGTEDATNILQAGNVLCSAITKIGIDHEAFLGSTLASVAEHKAGIIKPGVPCVIDGSNAPEVLETVQSRANLVGSDLHVTSSSDSAATFVDQNKLVASTALRIAFPQLQESQIDEGIAAAHWPGRLQWIDDHTLVDGAHNEPAARELRKFLDNLGEQRIRWVMAFSKPATSIMRILIRPGDTVVATEFGDIDEMPWIKPTPSSDIAKIAKELTPNVSIANSVSSIDPTFDGTTVICGSLYLVGSYLRTQR